MKRILLAFLLALSSLSARADWVRVGESEEAFFYADPSTIRKQGSFVRAWTLFSYHKPKKGPDGNPFQSIKNYEEFDCAEEVSRVRALQVFTKPMAGGEVLYSNADVAPWRPIAPDSVQHSVLEFVCRP